MSSTITQPTSSSASGQKMLQAMVGIGMICAMLIVLTYEGTRSRIEKNRAEALEQAIFKVIPGITRTAPFLATAEGKFIPATADNVKEGKLVYAGYNAEGKLTGIALTASGQGYADIIRVLYGYDPAQQAIVGLYVLESKETPGLGDKIEKDLAFLENFRALDVTLEDDLTQLKNRVVPVKHGNKEHPWEIDGITGATISSRAIGDMLGASTEQWIPQIYQQLEVFETSSTEKNE